MWTWGPIFFFNLLAHLFLSLNSPRHRRTTVCLYIHLLNDILVASNFWCSWRKPMCRFLCRYTFWNQDHDYWFDKARFNFERHCQNAFLSSCAIVHFHQLWMRVIFSLPPPQQSVQSGILFCCFEYFCHSNRCIALAHSDLKSPPTNYVQHLFICRLCTVFGQESELFCQFLHRVVYILLFFVYFGHKFFIRCAFANIFSYSVLVFHSHTVLFRTKVFKSNEVQLNSSFLDRTFCVLSAYSSPNLTSYRFSPRLSSGFALYLGLGLFWINFCERCKVGV